MIFFVLFLVCLMVNLWMSLAYHVSWIIEIAFYEFSSFYNLYMAFNQSICNMLSWLLTSESFSNKKRNILLTVLIYWLLIAAQIIISSVKDCKHTSPVSYSQHLFALSLKKRELSEYFTSLKSLPSLIFVKISKILDILIEY